jgi:hypothetical protein
MNKKEQIYFNFPIVLLEGFLINDRLVLDNIFDYAIYTKTLQYEDGNTTEKIINASEYFGVKCGDVYKTFKNGKELFESIPEQTPKVGLNKDIYFDYLKNLKDDFQKVCLLGFLAIKSILQIKPYCKLDNKFWLSRMDGKACSVDFHSAELTRFGNKYQLTKIKNELIDNWGLRHYSRYTRGFYVSVNLSLEDLIFQAEKRRKSTLEKQRKESEKSALKKALERLNNNNTISTP